MPAPDKVVLTIDRKSPLWAAARADSASAFLPYILREIIEGNVEEVTVNATDWVKLQSYILTLPGGSVAMPFAVADALPERPQETSPRAVVARKFAAIFRELGACSPYGGDVVREESGRYYAVAFGYGARVVGTVQIYSPEYVRVAYVSQTKEAPPNGLPPQDIRTFGSVDHAAKFVTLAIQRKYAEALAIPLRESKRKQT